MPIAHSDRNPVKIHKKQGSGRRGKALRNNPCSSVDYLRGRRPSSLRQARKLEYHCLLTSIFSSKNIEESSSWKPKDLNCIVCDITVTSKKQLQKHFLSYKRKANVWDCTPKYFNPCRIYSGFTTEQLWEAHIKSRRHNKNISKLPSERRVPNQYGFTN